MHSFRSHDPLPEIPAAEAHHRAQQGEVLLLDVREAFELAQARVAGAVNIPLGELSVRHAELDRDRPVAVICRSGNRSAMAVAHLRQLGIDAVNVADGLIGWHGADLPLADGRTRVA
jgi:rhodanese-related sulfurtransferase